MSTLPALSSASGLQLGCYREEHVAERIRRAVSREGLADEQALARVLRSDAAARLRFRRSVAVTVSGLFRDPAQFELLERELLPPLVTSGRRLSVWSAGSADGTELYSVAIMLDRLGVLERARLLGSDVLDENVASSKVARYLEPALAERLRARTRWECRDILSDGAPPGHWRLVLCRNLAIYLAPRAKEHLYETLAGALARDGVLLLGRSERIVRPAAFGLESVAPHAYRRAR